MEGWNGRVMQALQEEASLLDSEASVLRVDVDDLRAELAAAARETARRQAELAALDTPSRQWARLLASSAFLVVALVVAAFTLIGGAP